MFFVVVFVILLAPLLLLLLLLLMLVVGGVAVAAAAAAGIVGAVVFVVTLPPIVRVLFSFIFPFPWCVQQPSLLAREDIITFLMLVFMVVGIGGVAAAAVAASMTVVVVVPVVALQPALFFVFVILPPSIYSWKQPSVSEEAKVYCRRYSATGYPHMALVDPRTGMKVWSFQGFLESPEFIEKGETCLPWRGGMPDLLLSCNFLDVRGVTLSPITRVLASISRLANARHGYEEHSILASI